VSGTQLPKDIRVANESSGITSQSLYTPCPGSFLECQFPDSNLTGPSSDSIMILDIPSGKSIACAFSIAVVLPRSNQAPTKSIGRSRKRIHFGTEERVSASIIAHTRYVVDIYVGLDVGLPY
jgi:hypothetical protein